MMVVTRGDAWRTTRSDGIDEMKQQPPALLQPRPWQQQALGETFTIHSPLESLGRRNLHCVEKWVSFPTRDECSDWVVGRGTPPAGPVQRALTIIVARTNEMIPSVEPGSPATRNSGIMDK